MKEAVHTSDLFAGEARYPLDWIDEYVTRIRAYVHVRARDNLLIKIPNEAFKLNPPGVRILKRLFAGEKVLTLWQSFGGSIEVRRDLYDFFIALKQALQGCLNEHRPPAAVSVQPFALGLSELPVLSEVALTYRCNSRCRFCYAGCGRPKHDNGPEMTTTQVKRVLRIIRDDVETPSVSFTGGEPTLREDLDELVSFARHDAGLHVNLITNGTLIDRTRARALKKAGLDSAQVSLESPREPVHDALTGMPGSFRSAVAAIRHLIDAGVRVHTNTTLTRANIDAAPDMAAFVRHLGLDRFSMNLMIPTEETEKDAPDLGLMYTEMSEHILRIQRAAEDVKVEFMWYSPTPICVFNPIEHRLGNKGCAACDGLFSISPSGDVLPCSSWAEPVGNILSTPFEQIWQSAPARRLRAKRFAPEGCPDCEHFALCQGGCPLYWRQFGYGELQSRQKGHCHAVAGR